MFRIFRRRKQRQASMPAATPLPLPAAPTRSINDRAEELRRRMAASSPAARPELPQRRSLADRYVHWLRDNHIAYTDSEKQRWVVMKRRSMRPLWSVTVDRDGKLSVWSDASFHATGSAPPEHEVLREAIAAMVAQTGVRWPYDD